MSRWAFIDPFVLVENGPGEEPASQRTSKKGHRLQTYEVGYPGQLGRREDAISRDLAGLTGFQAGSEEAGPRECAPFETCGRGEWVGGRCPFWESVERRRSGTLGQRRPRRGIRPGVATFSFIGQLPGPATLREPL